MLVSYLPLLLLPTSFALFSSSTTADESLKVPGSNPLYFCKDPVAANHVLRITNVDVDPWPLRPGEKLSIKATGNFTKEVEDGSYVDLLVKFGPITLVRRREDLCELMQQVEKECPLEKGESTITKEVDLPGLIPKGKFIVTADAFGADNEVLTCLQAEAQIGGTSAAKEEESVDL